MHNKINIFSVFLLVFLCSCSEESTDSSEIINARIASKSKMTFHVVKKGETLKSVASLYGMTQTELKNLNTKLTPPYKLISGQRLRVRMIKPAVDHKYYAENAGLVLNDLPNDTPQVIDVSKNMNNYEELASSPQTNSHPYQDDNQKDAEFSKNLWGQDEPLMDQKINSPTITNDPYGENLPAKQSSNVNPAYHAFGSGESYPWPVSGRVTQHFGEKSPSGDTSNSIYIKAPVGVKVKSVASGKVTVAGKLREVPQFGNIVVVKQGNDKTFFYGSLKEIYVKKGDTIDAGKVIGTVGKHKNEPMLVFRLAIKKGNKMISVDPEKYLTH
jgi:murein DD-endopeptidase MepM/ murein hydrolase activator NlpD